MENRRLQSWLESEAVLPGEGRVAVFNAWAGLDLPGLAPDRIRAVQPIAPVHEALKAKGLNTAKIPNYSYDAVILRVPREKDRALGYLKDAVRRTPDGAVIVIDGQKTDGIESFLKLCRKRFAVEEVISKAHGKLFWFRKRGMEEDVMQVLDLPELAPVAKPFGFHTAPGVFSADGVDPGSAFLADHLPDLKGEIADLGAGWGYLAHRIFEKSAPEALHLVEADWLAVASAQENVAHEAAAFHWADATTWKPPALLDHVVTNPPFHTSRKADPGIGRAFIRAAAGMLKPKGSLWLVANRHLPYESDLEDAFRNVQPLALNPSFKIFHASSPKRARKG